MLKPYKDLVKIDVTKYCDMRKEKEKVDGKWVEKEIPYLSWAKCVELLHENGAEKVYFEPVINERTGGTLFYTDIAFSNNKSGDEARVNRCYEVRVHIVIDDDYDFIYNFPLMNGKNAVCDNSLNQLRVSNAQARAFVKGVAVRTGLGFNLWNKNDESTTIPEEEEKLSPTALLKLRERFGQEWTRLLTSGMSADEIAVKLGLTDRDAVQARFSMFTELYNLLVKIIDL